ncbi:MAG: histidine phosphatase family protein [Propionibacteriaceae bacterium]|jgi:broad specificity phosphatase PhoE|nr:histidine phosphatase family protein [Propionibacteriaceae bacterium]
MAVSVVHLVRHGQVDNPGGVLYGRLPGFHLSDLGRQMAQAVGRYFADFDLSYLVCSPLERAQETMAPIAANHPGLEIHTDPRVTEAANLFQGQSFGRYNQNLLRPSNFKHLLNPLRPSWGESYLGIAARMGQAIAEAAERCAGHEAVVVSHELPIWMARLSAEGKHLWHDPRKRQARLASVTSFSFEDGRLRRIDYAEPAADLLPPRKRRFRPGA